MPFYVRSMGRLLNSVGLKANFAFGLKGNFGLGCYPLDEIWGLLEMDSVPSAS